MALEKRDLETIASLVGEQIEQKLDSFRKEIREDNSSFRREIKHEIKREFRLFSLEVRQETKQELGKVRLEIRDEIKKEIEPLREEIREKFNEVSNNFDALFLRDEKREHEYLALREQQNKLESRVEVLEKKVA